MLLYWDGQFLLHSDALWRISVSVSAAHSCSVLNCISMFNKEQRYHDIQLPSYSASPFCLLRPGTCYLLGKVKDEDFYIFNKENPQPHTIHPSWKDQAGVSQRPKRPHHGGPSRRPISLLSHIAHIAHLNSPSPSPDNSTYLRTHSRWAIVLARRRQATDQGGHQTNQRITPVRQFPTTRPK